MLFVADSIQLVRQRKLLKGPGDFEIEGHVSRTVKYADYLAFLAMEETVLQGMTE
jgi:hypothetical protein